MPDSDSSNNDQKTTSNLPAVVHDGEVMRPAAESWLTRAIRSLFGWKPGSVRADLQVVLDASHPGRDRLLDHRAHHAAQHPRSARAAYRGRDDPSRRYRRRETGYFARRIDGPVRKRRAFASGRLPRNSRRSRRIVTSAICSPT